MKSARFGRYLMLAISVAIIAYVVNEARHDRAFVDLRDQPKDWGMLAGAWFCMMAAVIVTILRWYLLVRALALPFRLRDAFRLGFVGYLLNFASLGSVGGDLFKAIFIAREQPGRRTEAVATVVIDRVIGLYALFLLATIGILATGQLSSEVPRIRMICSTAVILTAVGSVGMLMMVVPGFTSGAVSEMVTSIPKVGRTIGRLIRAIRMYRRNWSVLIVTIGMSLVVHSLISVGIYLVARGLPGEVHTLANHFVIVPLAMVSGVLPLPFMGLGALEVILEYLYQNLAQGVGVIAGQGYVISLGYRIITITIAALGMVIYLARRREVTELMHEAEQQAESDAEMASQPSQADEPLRAESSGTSASTL